MQPDGSGQRGCRPGARQIEWDTAAELRARPNRALASGAAEAEYLGMLRPGALLAVLALVSCSGGGARPVDCACTAAIGATECRSDADCVAIAAGPIAVLSSPQISPYHVVGSACTEAGVWGGMDWIQGPACQCQLQGGGTLLIGPTGVACSLASRGGGCLWDTTQWPACDPASKISCVGTCYDAEGRLAIDAARVFESEVRLARCGQVYCDIVVRVEDRCYVRSPSESPAYDCALSDDQIIAAERARIGTLSTGAGGTSGSIGTTSVSGTGGTSGSGGGSGGSCRC
jgi:hypothetical protein